MKLKYFAIITRDGKLKRGSNGYAVYTQYRRACFWADDDGDSVVEVEIDLEKAPLYIKRKVL